ncbi:MAG: ComEC/Rec2 family competence protein [Bacilli bacterium]|nr:ComEC/Rec2 family competence protein [Bacilli bacterium]
MTKKKKKQKLPKGISILLIIVAIFYSLYEKDIDKTFGLPVTETFQETENTNTLDITYLDVGQADSILIQNKGHNMLIDAGNNEDGPLLVQYFKEQNINKFDYLITTHPHEDHIGGMDDIINNFDIEKIYMPDVTTTTKTFLDVLEAIEKKNMTYDVPNINQNFTLGNTLFQVIYTGNDKKNLNNSSIILKATFKNTSYLFTGDATSEVEKKILNKNIQATVLKVGHHGSKYSTTTDFLNKVNPKYAIISVGKNNSYNHPNQVTINKLEKKNIEIHRTDQEGSIFLKSDGKTINITSKKTNTNGG